jgi:peroxiredoxin
MPKLTSRSILPLVAVTALAMAAPVGAAVVGAPAPTFTLTDLHGVQHSLDEYRGRQVVLEWINPNCPYSRRHAEEHTMVDLAAREDAVFLAINSTAPDSGDYLQPAAHLEYNRRHGIEYAVLYDPTGEVGHAYSAKTTPHMFLIDEAGTLVYDGAIDDDPRGRMSRAERTNYLALGLDERLAGDAVDPSTTKPYGCSVKYAD